MVTHEQIRDLAMQCAQSALDEGATRAIDPMEGDWCEFRELVGVHESECEEQARVFTNYYKVHMTNKLY